MLRAAPNPFQVWLATGLTLAVVGAILGATAIHLWLRMRQKRPTSDM